jgi:type I restriction enzyme S subunit
MTADVKPYLAMKDSVVPWLGDVPEHWRTERAKWLFRKMNRPVRESDEVVTCFRDGTVTLRKNRRVRGFTESLKEIGYQGIRRGDLVIHAMDAFAGAVGVSDVDGKGTPVYSVCEPRSMVDAHYYAYVIREMARSQWIQALAKGIRERSTDFRFEGFGSQPVPVPPLPEQAAIVRFLDHAERRIRHYIRAKQRLIKLLEEQKRAIVHHAVTRGLDTQVRAKPSGIDWIGDVPEHWEIWQVRHFATVGNGSTPSRGNAAYWSGGAFPWLNSSSVNAGIITASDQFVTETALRECHLPRVQPGSVLVAITGQGKTRGTAAVLSIEATINQHIAFIAPRRQKRTATPEYLRLFLVAAYPELRRISEDSGSTKGALTCEDLKHFRVLMPPADEQNRIVSIAREETAGVETNLRGVEREISLLREYRTRLIADVVTGKLDVRDAAARLPEDASDTEPLDEADAEVEGEESAEQVEAVAEEAGA